VRQVAAGGLKVIAVASEKRGKILPDVPTLKESGIDVVAAPWQGIMAPKNTPRPIIDKLNAAIGEYLKTDEAREKFATIGMTPLHTTPEAAQATVAHEETLWRDVIKKNNIRSE
jgi:tripartite-type tricarboxylate transporter receptor subunit TctC